MFKWMYKIFESKVYIDFSKKSVHNFKHSYMMFGLLFVFMSVLPVFIFRIEQKSDSLKNLYLLYFCFFSVKGFYRVLNGRDGTLYLGENEISYLGGFGLRTVNNLKWDEIVSIKYNRILSAIIFKNKKGKRILAHKQLEDFSQIIEMIEKKKGLTKQDIKFPY